MRTRNLRASLICLAICPLSYAGAEVPDEYLAVGAASAFGAPPTIGQPRLSPDGTQMIFVSQNPTGASFLQSLDLADGTISTLRTANAQSGYDVHWCEFASEDRILCDYRRGIPYSTTEYQVFFAMDRDGGNSIEMPRGLGCDADGPRGVPFVHMETLRNTPTIDWLADDPDHVMLICGRRVTRVNLIDGSTTDLRGIDEAGNDQSLMIDGHGLAKIYRSRNENSEQWYFREVDDDDWVRFHETDSLIRDNPLRPVGYGSRTDRLFNIAWDDGNGTWGLFVKDLSGDYVNRHVFSHELVDVELVDTLGPTERVVSAAYLEDRPLRAVIDPRVGEVLEFVSGLLPGIDIEVIDESWDQNIYLLRARAPRAAGEILAVNMETGAVQGIGPEYAHLTGFELAETRIVQFEGDDGDMLTAHLTLPAIETEGPIPAVVIPRPQASHQDIEDPHYLVQFLAANGYAVLRVRNGGPGWHALRAPVTWEKSADDIAVGVRYLIDQGITTAGNVCATGRDFGAHSALMTAVRHPDLLACVVSIAGIVDPHSMPASDAISADVLDQSSPILRAGEIGPPALLFHGRNDADADLDEHTFALFRALRRADNDVQFIEYPYASHAIGQGRYRVDMLTRIGQHLGAHIGVNPAYADQILPPED